MIFTQILICKYVIIICFIFKKIADIFTILLCDFSYILLIYVNNEIHIYMKYNSIHILFYSYWVVFSVHSKQFLILMAEKNRCS